MPLVLATGAPTASGHDYEDVTGVRYEFPKQYQSLFTAGERFLYFRGRRAARLGLQGLVYFGTGVIGRVQLAGEGELPGSSGARRRMVADILDYLEFDRPVPFKMPDGSYMEPVPAGDRQHFRRGVRRVEDNVFARILELGVERPEPTDSIEARSISRGFAVDPQEGRQVEEYAVEIALEALRKEWPDAKLTVMPRNNPGFDIKLSDPRWGTRYIEVKGTRFARPEFLLTEGERRFADSNNERYDIVVVYGIDLARRTHRILRHADGLRPPNAYLTPQTWRVVLRERS